MAKKGMEQWEETRREWKGGTWISLQSECFFLFLASGCFGFFKSSTLRTSAMQANDLALPE